MASVLPSCCTRTSTLGPIRSNEALSALAVPGTRNKNKHPTKTAADPPKLKIEFLKPNDSHMNWYSDSLSTNVMSGRLGKTAVDFALKGRGFQPRRIRLKITTALAVSLAPKDSGS